MIDFTKIFKEYIEANAKQWGTERDKTVGASEIFGCMRQAWFKRFGEMNGYEINEGEEQDWGAAKRGDLLEAHFVVPAIRDHLPGNVKLILAGSTQKTLFHKYNSATPDGLLIGLQKDDLVSYGIPDVGPSGCVAFEIKSIDPRVNLHHEKDIHFGQVQTQLGLIRQLTEYKPDYGIIIYIDASFLSRHKIFSIPFVPEIWKTAQKRAEKIMTAKTPVELLPEGKIDGGCDFCLFTAACANVTISSIPPDISKKLDAAKVAELEPILERRKLLQLAAKDAEANFQQASMDLKEALKNIKSRKVKKSGEWTVSWYSQAGRRTLDTDLVKERLGLDNLDNFMKEGEPFDVLRVTYTKENTEGAIESD